MKLAGNDILIQSLINEEVEYIFGYPGGAALHIYDSIFKQKEMQHILVRHEQGATHAADGYARSTGKPGVVLVTSGPGATNAVTGAKIAEDAVDSVHLAGLSIDQEHISIGAVVSGHLQNSTNSSTAFSSSEAKAAISSCSGLSCLTAEE